MNKNIFGYVVAVLMTLSLQAQEVGLAVCRNLTLHNQTNYPAFFVKPGQAMEVMNEIPAHGSEVVYQDCSPLGGNVPLIGAILDIHVNDQPVQLNYAPHLTTNTDYALVETGAGFEIRESTHEGAYEKGRILPYDEVTTAGGAILPVRKRSSMQ